MRTILTIVLVGLFSLVASADTIVFEGTGADTGLSGTADFSLEGGGTILKIVLTNTSTSLPAHLMGGSANSNQLLTSLSFDLPGGVTITGGEAKITAGSVSVNFDQILMQLAGGADVSGEYGYGNTTQNTGLLFNFVTGNEAHATPFGGTNLDGAAGLNGPQAGLTNGLVPIGGLGAIDNSVTFRLVLSAPLSDLSFLESGAIIEFGSDAAFLRHWLQVPEPAAAALIAIAFGGVFTLRRRRRAA